ncbi:MAG: hypothetical protein KGD57_06270 [Candidatus Lokiarchaeota archaeon]|nr:hypothetical protein [Candidatus Lokiarchaeota archaeon]
MIKGIKRKTTAIESTFRYFQTIDLILSHFKREADKEKIFELVEKKTTLKDLLVATAAVHIYHNLGIRVGEFLEIDKGTVEYSINLEINEKKTIYKEVKLLLKDSFESEINILYKLIDLEDKFLELLIEVRKKDILESEKENLIKNIDKDIEKELLEIVLHYPPFNFYDLIGDLIGLTNEMKLRILNEGAKFKDISIDIEQKLEREDKEDKYIEFSTLTRIMTQIQEDFEFKSYQELKMQAMPVRMIKKRIIEHDLNRFPISIPGLRAFKNANKLKRTLIRIIENALDTDIDYEKFEQKVFSFLKKELIIQFKANPNDFIYFLQNINEESFNEIIYALNKYGIYNILQIINVDEDLVAEIEENMIRYNIQKFDIMQLNDQKKNIVNISKKALIEINNSSKRELRNNQENLNLTLNDLLKRERDEFEELWDLIEKNTNYTYKELKDFEKKKEIVDNIFLKNLNLVNYSQILFLLDFKDILNNIVKDIFFYILSKILRQLSRIIESYLKISNEKALYLLALRKMYKTTKSDEWVWIKLEELLIKRLKKRQRELVLLLNAENRPFLINGFIFARLTDTSLEKAMNLFKNETSPIYKNIKDLKLKKDLISPISYCIGYDLIKRFESFEELRKQKVIEVIKAKENEEKHLKKKIREKQETSTLNWIERRITSSLMRINSPGINPNQLYWQEKDTKTATDNIKLHSELDGEPLELITEYFLFSIDKIKSLTPDIKLPNPEMVKTVVKNIIEQTLEKRLKNILDTNDQIKLYDGERYEIAKQIANKIGKFLDKALYLKFKSKHKNI